MFNLKIFGDFEISATLDDLKKALDDRAFREGLEHAVGPFIEHARRLAQEKHPRTAESIGVEIVQDGNGWSIVIGPTLPKGAKASIFEFGTGPRYHRNGKYVGQVSATPFMRPAWDQGKDRILEGVRQQIEKTVAARIALRDSNRLTG